MNKLTPNGWSYLRLDSIVEKFIVPMRDKPKLFSGSIPWVRIEDFEGKYLTESKSRQCVSQETINEMHLKVYPVGTVLCSCSARLGVCTITARELVSNQTFIGLVPKKDVEKEYLYYRMEYHAVDLQNLSSGTTIAYLPRDKFEEFQVLVPPLPEQQKIASILTAVDDVIESTQAQINKLKDLKIGMMQELLTKGIGHTEFKDSPVGRIPKSWKIIKLRDIVTRFQNGYAFGSGGYVEDGIPIISMGCLGLDGRFNEKYAKQKFWTYEDKEALDRYIVRPKDVLMAMTDVTPTMDLIGRSCIAEIRGEAFLNQRVGLIDIDSSKACKYYISYFTNFDIWRAYAKGSSGLGAQANLGTQQILDGAILLPPLSEQQKISAALTSVDDEVKSLQEKLSHTQNIKKSLMQDLLAGKVRVKVN